MPKIESAAKMSSQELGLILGTLVLGIDDLHYGYWSAELDVCLENLPAAQAVYSEHLIQNIPAGVKTILDVGCGTGSVAEKLIDRGYRVECISPSDTLADLAEARLGGRALVHHCRYEDFEPTRSFDLVLCCESFQYLSLELVFDRAARMLEPGGHFLICDFFKQDVPHRSPLGGGHRISAFHKQLNECPFEVVLELDLTAATAPNLDLFGQLTEQRLVPIWENVGQFVRTNYPKSAWLIGRVFRKKLAKIEDRVIRRILNSEVFKRDKLYQLILLRRLAS